MEVFMSGLKFTSSSDFSKTEKYLKRAQRTARIGEYADVIGHRCVEELKKVTPKDSGLTAESWDYEININGKQTSILFTNTNIQNGMNVALLLEFGHGTPSGVWVEGQEYIEPVMRQVYLEVLNIKWKELTRL